MGGAIFQRIHLTPYHTREPISLSLSLNGEQGETFWGPPLKTGLQNQRELETKYGLFIKPWGELVSQPPSPVALPPSLPSPPSARTRHRHLDLLLEDVDLVLLLNQLLLLLGDLLRHGVDKGITAGPGPSPAPAPAYP